MLKKRFVVSICLLFPLSTYAETTLKDLEKIVALQQARIAKLENSFPIGTVIHIEANSCPSGWTQFSKANGRYIVSANADIGKTVGTALTNGEVRPTGAHTHAITDPGHRHLIGPLFRDSHFADNNLPPRGSNAPVQGQIKTDASKTGIKVNSSGIAGTNAPYIQLLACQKK